MIIDQCIHAWFYVNYQMHRTLMWLWLQSNDILLFSTPVLITSYNMRVLSRLVISFIKIYFFYSGIDLRDQGYREKTELY